MVKIESFLPYEQELVDTYKSIHMHPEFGFEEVRTAGIVAEKLRSWGLEVQENMAITGVVGTLDSGKPGKCIMLRADMDALPVIEQSGFDYSSREEGKMHACGHDSHVSMLLGTAHFLADHKEMFTGKVKFVFQPAEEGITPEKREKMLAEGYSTCGGAELLIQQGVMENVDACAAIHIATSLRPGQVKIMKKEAMSAADQFEFEIIGKGGHGSAPHETNDAVSAAAAAINAIHLIPSRDVSTREKCVVGIGEISTPGSRFNIIPARVVFGGTVRTFNQQVREHITKTIEKRVKAAAELYDCDYRFKYINLYDATINDPDMSAFACNIAKELFGEENVFYTDEADMGSEDVGYYFQKAPGVMINLGGAHPDDESPAMLHSPFVRLDLGAFKYGVAMHTNLVLEYLTAAEQPGREN